MRYLPYNKDLKGFSRELRNHSTRGEILLWKKLRAGGMMGYQFYRQKIIENFIVDFYCPALKLVIEVDGTYHSQDADAVNEDIRDEKLKEWNLKILRFKENEVRRNIQLALLHIENYIVHAQAINPAIIEKAQRKTNPPHPL